jgi:hypothetical protein
MEKIENSHSCDANVWSFVVPSSYINLSPE